MIPRLERPGPARRFGVAKRAIDRPCDLVEPRAQAGADKHSQVCAGTGAIGPGHHRQRICEARATYFGTGSEAQRVKELEREVKELRRANEILKLASTFFAQAEPHRRFKS